MARTQKLTALSENSLAESVINESKQSPLGPVAVPPQDKKHNGITLNFGHQVNVKKEDPIYMEDGTILNEENA